MDIKCIFLNERSLSKKSTYYVIVTDILEKENL